MKIQKSHSLFFAGLLLALTLIRPAAAHTGGFTYEATVNNHFVDIGSSELEFIPNDLSLFEYNIYSNTDPNNLADFDNVYITVGDESAVLLSTFVHRPQGMLTVLSYSFPKPGKYEMTARFQKGPTTLAEVSFPIEVGEDEAVTAAAKWIKIGIIIVSVALVIVATLIKIKRKQDHQLDK
jgi:hypothetical protein